MSKPKTVLITTCLAAGFFVVLGVTANPPARAQGQHLITNRSSALPIISPARQAAAPLSVATAQPTAAVTERDAAERALAFLAEAAPAWDKQHGCYGCHVQAVAAMAFTIGEQHQYTVKRSARDHMVRSLLDGKGGAHAPQPFTVSGGGSLPHAGAAFGGAALAALDEAEIGKVTPDLIKTARRLLSYQGDDGVVINDDARPPVIPSDVATTYLATQTWRQAYARTADSEWLAPIRKAERWLHQRAAQWSDEPPAEIQPINYALLGLLEAGASAGEPIPKALTRELLRRQGEDGSWSFTAGDSPSAFATGQSVYVLRRLGFDDQAAPVDRGTRWLISHQTTNGDWGGGGAGQAAAMWGVMGLVSIDVMSIEMIGLSDGQHVEGRLALKARAVDNTQSDDSSVAGGVTRVQMFVDDVQVHTAEGAALDYTWDVRGLEPGMHLVDLVARNTAGKETRRRVRVFAGDTFLTEVGSRWQDGKTVFSVRNIAPERLLGRVKLAVYEDAGDGKKGKQVATTTHGALAGAHSIPWAGGVKKGASYLAELTLIDKDGGQRHTVSHPFVHDDPQAANARFAQLAGKLELDGDQAAANTRIELVDGAGNVVQSMSSTRSGQWRFKNVKKGNYRVRINKNGFKSEEHDVEAEPAEESLLDLSLSRE